jgi:hypothetical protein
MKDDSNKLGADLDILLSLLVREKSRTYLVDFSSRPKSRW